MKKLTQLSKVMIVLIFSIVFITKPSSGMIVLAGTVLDEDIPIVIHTTEEHFQMYVDWYSKEYQVSNEEAREQITSMNAATQFANEVVSAKYPDTFSGFYIEHSPEFRLVFMFTAFDENNWNLMSSVPQWVKYSEVRLVEYSLLELQGALHLLEERAMLTNFTGFAYGIDIPTNRIFISLSKEDDRSQVLDFLSLEFPLTGMFHVECCINLQMQAAVYAGMDANVIPSADVNFTPITSNCTTGWIAANQSNNPIALTTAAHCGERRDLGSTEDWEYRAKLETMYIGSNFFTVLREKIGGNFDVAGYSIGSHTPYPFVVDGRVGSSYSVISVKGYARITTLGPKFCTN